MASISDFLTLNNILKATSFLNLLVGGAASVALVAEEISTKKRLTDMKTVVQLDSVHLFSKGLIQSAITSLPPGHPLKAKLAQILAAGDLLLIAFLLQNYFQSATPPKCTALGVGLLSLECLALGYLGCQEAKQTPQN